VRLYGRTDSAEAYELRDFLNRSVVQFDWVEVTPGKDSAKQLGLPQLTDAQLPICRATKWRTFIPRDGS
jgi:thioredoxin reductase (NADPH)